MSELIHAPWTDEQVNFLNQFQYAPNVHPFTCGGDRSDETHSTYQEKHGGDFGQLVATVEGWICPSCNYTQDWAHAWMADPQFLKTNAELWERMFRKS